MTLDTFAWRVAPEILDRGLQYHREGRVQALEEESPLTYRALVKGSSDYRVRVSLSETGEILTSTCDCPYHGGPVCKHQVAVYQAVAEHFGERGDRIKDKKKALIHLPQWRQRELLLLLEEQIDLTPEDFVHAERNEGLMSFYRELMQAETEVAFDRLIENDDKRQDPLGYLDRRLLLRAVGIERRRKVPETLQAEIEETVGWIAREGGDQAATLLEVLFSPRISDGFFRLSLLEIFLAHSTDRTRRHQLYSGLKVMHMYAHGALQRAILALIHEIHPDRSEIPIESQE